MPWRERSVMEERLEFVRLCTSPGAQMSELCRRFGISRKQGYKWRARYLAAGEAGLGERSRRPKASPRRTSEAMEAAVLGLRAEHNNAWGGRKIATVLARAGLAQVPAASTITAILRRHGKLVERAHEHPGSYCRFEHAAPNDLWQMDFKGHFPAGTGRCHPLTVLDDHSRYALGLEAMGCEQDQEVRLRLVALFRRFGLPLRLLCDNGAPWGDSGLERHTALAIWLMRLGIKLSHGRPHHPQTQGKDERFHRSLKAEVLAGRSFKDLAHCQRAFDRWRDIYNGQRPHEALDLAVPAERYRISPRTYPETLPAIEYAAGDIVRKVDTTGRISFKSHILRIGKAFRHEPVALRPDTTDGHYSVHYCAHRIGWIDLHSMLFTTGGKAVENTPSDPPAEPQQQQQEET